jgi:hypothetical protein
MYQRRLHSSRSGVCFKSTEEQSSRRREWTRAIRRTGNGSREAFRKLEALDGTGKALTTKGTTEEFGKCGPQGSQVSGDFEVTSSCGLEAEPDLQKIGKKGRYPAREIAPSLLRMPQVTLIRSAA